MARQPTIISTCDPCDHDDLTNVPAVTTHVISIDGGPPREIDFCGRDDLNVQKLLAVYQAYGRDLPKPEEHKKTATSKKAAPKELPGGPPEGTPKVARPESQKKLAVVCPLDHPTQGGGPRRVSYVDRTSHVDQCHQGIRPQEVKWEDPDGILNHYCPHCVQYGFTTARGLSHHLRMFHAAKEMEGDLQKTDEPATAGAESSA